MELVFSLQLDNTRKISKAKENRAIYDIILLRVSNNRGELMYKNNNENVHTVRASELSQGNIRKIFDDLYKVGVVKVIDDGNSVAVLISPVKFEEIMESLDNYELLLTAFNRMNTSTTKTMTMNEIMNGFGITQSDLDSIEVDLDLDLDL